MKRTVTLFAAAATFVSLFAATPAFAAEEPEASAAVRCDEGHWPASVQGPPRAFKVGGTAGYYIWHDASGWHLRTTTPSREGHTFSGRITASDDIKVLRIFKNEAADNVKLEGKTISFKFETHAHVDGIDFKVGCTNSVKFSLSAEGRRWPTRRIWLGATGHARSNPFTVTRVG